MSSHVLQRHSDNGALLLWDISKIPAQLEIRRPPDEDNEDNDSAFSGDLGWREMDDPNEDGVSALEVVPLLLLRLWTVLLGRFEY
jgi:hypothetical protein